jgi:carbamoyltransferase
MYILGINVFHGDVSAALLRDGDLVMAVEEERFRRIKHWAGFPTQSVRACLAAAGVDGSEIGAVAVSRDRRAHLLKKAAYVARRRPSLALVRDRLRHGRRVNSINTVLADALGVSEDRLPKIHSVEHHPAHLASSFFASPFDDAAVCAIDGFGDFVSTSLGRGTGAHLEVLERVHFPHSLGMLYTAVTQYLGFLSYGDEFKVMGLAPYGAPDFLGELRQLVTLKPNGLFKLDLQYFRHWSDGVDMEWEEGYPTMGTVYSKELERLLGPARDPKEPITPRHEAIARSLQAVYEECAFHVLDRLWTLTKNPRLAMAGGCAMNSVANGKIRANTRFEELYIQPASGDNGTALGAALWVWHQVMSNPRQFVMRHGYWGPEHQAESVVSKLEAARSSGLEIRWRREPDRQVVCDTVARAIADGNVVGWYQGRMEWGARALGHRSILADPRRVDMRELINTKIKFREKFRPFAPSILEEAVDDYFEGAVPDPFMIQVYPVRPDKRAVIPACTHVDGSGRLQTVSRLTSPVYWQLIKTFEQITGVPVLLNTSFNENEPIVNLPEEALDCYLRTQMDLLVINDLVVERVQAGTAERESADEAIPVTS